MLSVFLVPPVGWCSWRPPPHPVWSGSPSETTHGLLSHHTAVYQPEYMHKHTRILTLSPMIVIVLAHSCGKQHLRLLFLGWTISSNTNPVLKANSALGEFLNSFKNQRYFLSPLHLTLPATPYPPSSKPKPPSHFSCCLAQNNVPRSSLPTSIPNQPQANSAHVPLYYYCTSF